MTKPVPSEKCILVVDDNPINQEVTFHILSKAGYRAHIVCNGREALRAMATAHYDLILMDCQMPEMDGYEATQELRKDGHKLPIIALTAHCFQEDRDRCLAAGMSDYLSKPVESPSLLQVVTRWLSAPSPTSPYVDLTALERLDALDEDGSQNLVQNLIQLYVDTLPQGLHELRGAAMLPGARLKKQAHYLKSSNANLGLFKVTEILERIEQGLYETAELPELIAELEFEIENGIAELKRLRP